MAALQYFNYYDFGYIIKNGGVGDDFRTLYAKKLSAVSLLTYRNG